MGSSLPVYLAGGGKIGDFRVQSFTSTSDQYLVLGSFSETGQEAAQPLTLVVTEPWFDVVSSDDKRPELLIRHAKELEKVLATSKSDSLTHPSSER